jgi:aminoglycoside 3-N-acetyltransferase
MPDFRMRDAVRLAAELRALGVSPGQDLLVHCSMRSLGHVQNGPATLVQALEIAAGPEATLVVPAQTSGNSLSSRTFQAATAGLDAAARAAYVAEMPGFDPENTPSAGMGALAEYLRTRQEAARSAHPQSSFAALGPRALECTAGHRLNCHLGENSPLGWLYRAGAAVLLLGVGYAVCTAFHLAEYRLPEPPPLQLYQCFTLDGGVRREQEFTDIALSDEDFADVGAQLDSAAFVMHGRVGNGDCRLFPLREAVDFALAWPPFAEHRQRTSLQSSG